MSSKVSILCVLSIILVFSFSRELSGVPLEKVVQESPVVVAGKIEKIAHAERLKNDADYRYDIAYILVFRIFKNTLKDKKIKMGDKIPLRMPTINSKWQPSTDIYYNIGQEGIWILEYKEEFYWATYSKDYQPLEKAREIQDIILRQKELD